TTTASGTTRHTGDSPSLSVQQVSRQVGSGDFDAARVEQIRSAIQNGTLKMDAGKIADAALSDAQSLLSTR
ncbi:flagellar biosynthesis anti-sigma factor FlgM, partial [Raoultella ornithinolytica]